MQKKKKRNPNRICWSFATYCIFKFYFNNQCEANDVRVKINTNSQFNCRFASELWKLTAVKSNLKQIYGVVEASGLTENEAPN